MYRTHVALRTLLRSARIVPTSRLAACIVLTSCYELRVSYLRLVTNCLYRTYVPLRTACIVPTSRYELPVSYPRLVKNCLYRTYVSLRTACIVSYPRPVTKCGHAPVNRCCSASRLRQHASTTAPPSPCSPRSHHRRIFLLPAAIRIMKTTIRRQPLRPTASSCCSTAREAACMYLYLH